MTTVKAPKKKTIGEIAREELEASSQAFFAPIVGAGLVLRSISKDRTSASTPAKPRKSR